MIMDNDLIKASVSTGMDDDLKKKTVSISASMDDENTDDNLFNLKRLKDGYVTIVDKMGYGKFKPYLQRLFHAVEIMFIHEVNEFKKIDAKYQDMVRQCHIYEKTLAILKESQCNEFQTFNDSSNTYAIDDFTKVTPYLAPDLLQSTLGAGNAAGGSTSLQFRLPVRRSSISNRHYVSTPLGPTRTMKQAVPLAHFDDDSSFVLTNSLGFHHQQPQTEKQFVDAFTEPESLLIIEKKDFSCQMTPFYNDKEIETTHIFFEYQSTQTEIISTETIGCQMNPNLNDCSIQTILNELKDFSCQFMPTTNDQMTETVKKDFHTQTIQTDSISTNDCACQMSPVCTDQQIETMPIVTHDIALQSSFVDSKTYDDQPCQTEFILHIDTSTQYELDTDIPDCVILSSLLSEDLPVSNEVEISVENQFIQIDSKLFVDEECQTIDIYPCQLNESTQTPHIYSKDCATQSSITTVEDQNIQTEPTSNLYSSSLYIVPTSMNQSNCSSKIVILPKEHQIYPVLIDREVQCDWSSIDTEIPIVIENKMKKTDRRSIIQHQLDEKEKQMNRIIEEYATLYGEYETERRRNMDLTEARDRLADHIKILSDELGDREINQEKLLIKSCQQSKLINYMLPQIECSPMPKKVQKKHHSATSFRRLLPKFK